MQLLRERRSGHRCIGKLLNFPPDATQNGVDVERALGNPELIQ
jgi:hypothetical protein